MTWEIIDQHHSRAKVFGGWLVKSVVLQSANDKIVGVVSVAMAFVPDPEHKWKLEKI